MSASNRVTKGKVALVKSPKYWLARALGGEGGLERTKPNLRIDAISRRMEKTNELVKKATEEKLEHRVRRHCESEVSNIGDVGEGVEKEVKSRGGERKRWLRRRTMRTAEKDRRVVGAGFWE
ncbi:L-type lectin-domain containing receptor kinase S.1-like [Pyrus ussuriensis x Pyrus communis]|uniref:L-type lectin-domain containing receptor kinase S.1-like n=1 Tax=Pyrus ussuriensis x Pyrus communis TaxID=2448454 RepID=A0A5N5IA95_9ROSA|nr:L-type lectin-domain containing receptor kinase S.1-like [Pyrus ussuriensis x Pyrus communis]